MHPGEPHRESSSPPPSHAPATTPLPLSVAIVCKNNQDTIERTLASVAPFAAEIVAIDSGSTDQTIPILERYHAKVIHSDWLGHVRTKQKAIEACSHDWVLCIDSDESIEPALAASIRAAFASPSADGYEVNRKVYYRDRPLNHAWQPEWRVRLVNRHRFHWTGLDPHDSLQPLPPPADPTRPAARIQRLTGVMRHDSIGAFADFFVKQASHARTMARSLHASGKRGSILKLVSSPIGAMLKQVVVKQAWRDGYPGWLAASATAAGTLIKHAVLIELSNTPDDPR